MQGNLRTYKIWIKRNSRQKGDGTPYKVTVPRGVIVGQIMSSLKQAAQLLMLFKSDKIDTDTVHTAEEKQLMRKMFVEHGPNIIAVVSYLEQRYNWLFEEVIDSRNVVVLDMV